MHVTYNCIGEKNSGDEGRHNDLCDCTKISLQTVTNCPFEYNMENRTTGDISQYRKSMLIRYAKLPPYLHGVNVSDIDIKRVENDYAKRKLDDMNQKISVGNTRDANYIASSPDNRDLFGKDSQLKSRQMKTRKPWMDSVSSNCSRLSITSKEKFSEDASSEKDKRMDDIDQQRNDDHVKECELGVHEPCRFPRSDRTYVSDIPIQFRILNIQIHEDNALTH
jgi:hypothetical protein